MNVIYHTGLLMKDRLSNPAVDVKADKVWALYEAGNVLLFQRRVRPGVCEYLAVPVER